jgi:hypothetical protein
MDKMTWVTSWEAWRRVMGRPSSRQRRQVERFLETRPCMMYWGDSWFSSMLYLNLARQSVRRIDGLGILIGKPGATADKLFSVSQVKEKKGRLKGSPFDMVCLSAGGNDALSERLAAVFRDWVDRRRSDVLSVDQAFEVLMESPVFPTVRGAYTRALDAIGEVQAGRPHLRAVAHSYARITRIGVAADLTVANIGLIALLKNDAGPWLWQVMQHVLADKSEARRFAERMLIDGLVASVLRPLTEPAEYGAFFSLADFSQLAAPEAEAETFWNDEIHPTEAGFAVLAGVLNTHIRNVLPAEKQQAVL